MGTPDKTRRTARIQGARAPELGDLIACPECDGRLEVVQLSPVKLEGACQHPGRE